MKFTATVLLLLSGISALAYFFWYKPKLAANASTTSFTYQENRSRDNNQTLLRLYQKFLAAKHFIKAHDFNPRYCFLMDLRIGSGKNRFFVYNMEKDSVETAGLVTHGDGSDNGSADLTFSNTPNSHCTSLGK